MQTGGVLETTWDVIDLDPLFIRCSYNLQNDYIIFCIGSFFSCEETSSLLFAEALEESMNEMQFMNTPMHAFQKLMIQVRA